MQIFDTSGPICGIRGLIFGVSGPIFSTIEPIFDTREPIIGTSGPIFGCGKINGGQWVKISVKMSSLYLNTSNKYSDSLLKFASINVNIERIISNQPPSQLSKSLGSIQTSAIQNCSRPVLNTNPKRNHLACARSCHVLCQNDVGIIHIEFDRFWRSCFCMTDVFIQVLTLVYQKSYSFLFFQSQKWFGIHFFAIYRFLDKWLRLNLNYDK